MRYGVAGDGISAWSGGVFDYEDRLIRLKEIGYEGTERITAFSEADAVHMAAWNPRQRSSGFSSSARSVRSCLMRRTSRPWAVTRLQSSADTPNA